MVSWDPAKTSTDIGASGTGASINIGSNTAVFTSFKGMAVLNTPFTPNKYYFEGSFSFGGSGTWVTDIQLGMTKTAVPFTAGDLSFDGGAFGVADQALSTPAEAANGFAGASGTNHIVNIVPPPGNGSTLAIAVDVAGGKLWVAINGTYLLGGDPFAGTNPSLEFPLDTYYPAISLAAATSSDGATSSSASASISCNFGPSGFSGTIPFGYNTLVTDPVTSTNAQTLLRPTQAGIIKVGAAPDKRYYSWYKDRRS